MTDMNTKLKLVESTFNWILNGYIKTWLADSKDDFSSDFDPESAPGSSILVIETKEVFVKNTEGKWQKFGTSEVLG